MTAMFEAIISWPSFLTVLAVFGVAPGLVLRLLVFGYRHDDPRRRELIAQLYMIPRIERPLWVAEQLETVLFDGVLARLSRALRWPTRVRLAFLMWQAGILENNYTKSVNGRREMAKLLPFLRIDRDLPDIVVEDEDGKYVELTDRIQYRLEVRDTDDR